MKRLLMFILALCLLFSLLLTSCTPSNSTENGESSTSFDTDSGADESKAEGGDESGSEEVVYPERPDGYPTLAGSFMQPGAFANYSLQRMTTHLRYMREVGIDTIILQWSFENVGDKATRVYFDSSFDAADKASDFDESGKKLVETLLQAADSLDMKVFLGLNNNDEWWQKAVNDKAWLTDQIEIGLDGAKQLYDTYKQKYPNAFHGWYFVFEYYNFKATSVQIDNAAYLLDGFRDGLYDIDSSMPMMLSPFVSSSNSTAVEAGDLWEKVFAKTDFREGDIFCCQDSVGAGHIKLEELESYYRELKEAVEKEKGLRFWANNEDFTQSDWTTAPLDRFVEQMNISSKYVEEHITFAYSHYQNPDIVGKSGYHEAYKEYFETGKVPTLKLSAPEVTHTSQGNGVIVDIEGTLDNSSSTACSLYIDKNGELLTRIDLTNKHNVKNITFSFSDTNLEGEGVAVYEVYATDYSGNETAKTKIEVNYKGKTGVNIAAGKDYSYSKEPEAGYPDEGGAMTDGLFGTASYSSKEWVGFLGNPDIIIDLGKVEDGIFAFKVNTLGGGSAGVFSPNNITIFASDDGTNYTQVGARIFDPDTDNDSGSIVERTIFTSTESISGRYIKINVATNQSWIFIDEVEVIKE